MDGYHTCPRPTKVTTIDAPTTKVKINLYVIYHCGAHPHPVAVESAKYIPVNPRN